MPCTDNLQRFLFEDANIRGERVILDDSFKQVFKRYDYPAEVTDILGQALAAVSLIAAMLKFNGKISLQLQKGAMLPLLFTETNHLGQLRGLAQYTTNQPFTHFSDMVKGGILTVNLMPENGQPYQGVVTLNGENLAECLSNYFKQSEQLNTRLWLSTYEGRAAGLLLQQLPDSDAEDQLLWEELFVLTQTVTAKELNQLDNEQLLHLLYPEHNIQLFKPQSMQFHCPCSEEKALGSILMLDKGEITSLFKQQLFLESTCEFCHAHYRFDEDRVLQALCNKSDGSETRH